jgi:serine/threonine-protein kinase
VTASTDPDLPAVPAAPERQLPWVSGDVVGRYTLLAKIATGGMAEIWLAKQAGPRGFEKVIVIKRIVDSLSQDPDFVEMFLDEARIAAQLNHPNIVQIYDLGEHAGAYYIAMEYLPGENLAAIARLGVKAGAPLPIPYAVKIAAQACEGLGHAHGRIGVSGKKLNVVHRDVSPQNIIVTYEGLVKLVDFGIAKAANRGSQTMGGQIKGKFAYMAPEQAQGGAPIDARADLFALAVVLYELVTRSRLFHREDQYQALSAVTSAEAVQPAHERNPEVPPELSAVLSKALEKKPENRYPDARAFQGALEGWLKTQPSVNAGDVGAYMDRLFAQRITARAQLIESASKGELTPSAARDVLKHDTDHSMPGRTGNRTALARTGSGRNIVAVMIPSAIALLVSGVLLAKMLVKHDPPAAEPAAPVEVPQVGTVAIETDPPGAALLFDGNPVGSSPQTLKGLPLATHEVKATLSGRQTVTRSVTLSQAGEKAMVVLMLPEKAAPAPAPVEPPKPLADAPTAPVKPKAAPVAATGKLSLNTQPWTRVTFNGKALGDTPIIDVVLPVGRQTLKLQNEDKGLNLNIEVEIKAGQTTKKVLKL